MLTRCLTCRWCLAGYASSLRHMPRARRTEFRTACPSNTVCMHAWRAGRSQALRLPSRWCLARQTRRAASSLAPPHHARGEPSRAQLPARTRHASAHAHARARTQARTHAPMRLLESMRARFRHASRWIAHSPSTCRISHVHARAHAHAHGHGHAQAHAVAGGWRALMPRALAGCTRRPGRSPTAPQQASLGMRGNSVRGRHRSSSSPPMARSSRDAR